MNVRAIETRQPRTSPLVPFRRDLQTAHGTIGVEAWGRTDDTAKGLFAVVERAMQTDAFWTMLGRPTGEMP